MSINPNNNELENGTKTTFHVLLVSSKTIITNTISLFLVHCRIHYAHIL